MIKKLIGMKITNSSSNWLRYPQQGSWQWYLLLSIAIAALMVALGVNYSEYVESSVSTKGKGKWLFFILISLHHRVGAVGVFSLLSSMLLVSLGLCINKYRKRN
jgi:Na+-transporting NADH:ubiquinone oxidoreductase subunit NqrB